MITESSDKVIGPVVGRGRPDVRTSIESGEQREELGHAGVEGIPLHGQPQPGHAVPEWVAVARIVEEDRVAEVTRETAADGMGPRLVPVDRPHRGGVQDHRGADPGIARAVAATCTAVEGASRHACTIALKPSDRRLAYRWARPSWSDRPAEHRRGEVPVRMIKLAAGVAAIAVVIAACGGGASSAPSSGASSAPSSATSTEPSTAPGGGDCEVAAQGTTAAATVEIRGFAFSPDTVSVKAGDTVAWTNGDDAAHTATTTDGGCDTQSISKGTTIALDVQRRWDLCLQVQDPPDDDRDGRGDLLVGDRRAAGDQRGRPRRQVEDLRRRQAGLVEPAEELLERPEPRALEQLVELDRGDEASVLGPSLVQVGGGAPLEDDEAAAGSERAPAGPERPERIG